MIQTEAGHLNVTIAGNIWSHMLNVISTSREPEIGVGSPIYAVENELENAKENDIVTFCGFEPDGRIYIGRVKFTILYRGKSSENSHILLADTVW